MSNSVLLPLTEIYHVCKLIAHELMNVDLTTFFIPYLMSFICDNRNTYSDYTNELS